MVLIVTPRCGAEGAMVICKVDELAVVVALSVTVTVSVVSPTTVPVPPMTFPVILKPVGSAPVATAHE